jgi:preprotein translocase subunit YajC
VRNLLFIYLFFLKKRRRRKRRKEAIKKLYVALAEGIMLL